MTRLAREKKQLQDAVADFRPYLFGRRLRALQRRLRQFQETGPLRTVFLTTTESPMDLKEFTKKLKKAYTRIGTVQFLTEDQILREFEDFKSSGKTFEDWFVEFGDE